MIPSNIRRWAEPRLAQRKQTYRFTYDFAVNGGAVGTIVLTPANGVIPDKFVIQNAFFDVITPLNSAGAATAALTTSQTANDLISATAFDGAPWSSAGLKATLILLGTIATLKKTTAARNPALVVGTAALTAGKFILFVEGYQSE